MKKLIFLLIVVMVIPFLHAQDGTQEAIKPALLVIDIQNEYFQFMEERNEGRALTMINYAIHAFRQHDFPVIRIHHTNIEYGPAPDSEGFQFPEHVQVQDSDPQIVKNYPSAFKKTDLKKTLDDLGCNTLFLCGLSATGCVIATYYGALDLDYTTFMIHEALLSPNADHTDYVEEMLETVSYSTLKVMLQAMAE